MLQPNTKQIDRTKQAIDAYIQSIASNPEHRDGGYPYYLLHQPGEAILGTVIMFHGFSAKPHQMSRLAEYLFRNGFNVYQPSIAGHALINPAKNWCQVDLKPDIAEPLKAKVRRDPVLMNFLGNIEANPDGFVRPNQLQQIGIVSRLLMLEPRLLDIVEAVETPNDPDFDRYFTSSHREYLTQAQARLAELDAMPGAIYSVGLSAGGAVALGLAATRSDRIQRVVAYAPLLKVYGEDRRRYVNLAGPLDVQELGWDQTLRFPVGCLTAADRFGSSEVMTERSLNALQQISTFLVLTENEDAADIATNQDFFAKIGGTASGHRYHLYGASDLVPHPMVDPTEVSQNMSNRFWQSLYQETFRFLSKGEVDAANLRSFEQNADLPLVPSI